MPYRGMSETCNTLMACLNLSRMIDPTVKTSQHHRISSRTALTSLKQVIIKKLIKTEIKIKTI